MKCAVYHTHKWGGQPTLHSAMVSEVVPHQDDDQFKDLQVSSQISVDINIIEKYNNKNFNS